MSESWKEHLRRALPALALCALWALEIFIVQERTLAGPAELDFGVQAARGLVRLGLDLSVCAALMASLPYVALVALYILEVVFFTIAITYFDHFRSPLSLLQAWHNFGEGAAIGMGVFELLTWSALLLLVAAFAVKIFLIVHWRRAVIEEAHRRRVRGYAGAAAVVSLLLAIGVHGLTRSDGPATFSRLGSSYGYVIAGIWEAQYDRRDLLLARAEEVVKASEDVLGKEEYPFPIHERLVLIQVESLDWGLLGYDIDGEQVMPFLTKLAEKSARYRVEAIHIHGSGDADFVALNSVMPSPDVITYKIPDYPYRNPLPRFMEAHGFSTLALHGVTGEFYERRAAFNRMGFDRVIFREELEKDFGYEGIGWGVPDGDLFEASLKLLGESAGPAFQFIITVSSHTPFRPGRDPDRKVVSGSSIEERYFNAMRYVDNVLEKYISALPPGTSVGFYGDHNSAVRWRDYDSGRRGLKEYVPFLLYNTGEDLAALQRTREAPIATGGALSLIHVMDFLRGLIDAQYPATQNTQKVGEQP
ncbi:MAG: LTA synthase family protein [Chrysiogenetes bacterium]|nr:LTA synthase family protein [Chrysiogenetes bacterium]